MNPDYINKNELYVGAPRKSEDQQFLKYIQRQWNPQELAELLSCSYDSQPTNPLQGWHIRLNANIPKRPNYHLLFCKLLKEAKLVSNIIKYNLFNKSPRNGENVFFLPKTRKILQKLEIRQMSKFFAENYLD